MSADDDRPLVALLHGLARGRRSLAGLERAIAQAGYPTWARSYPSRRQPIAALAQQLARQIRDEAAGREVVVVTHSLGGILVRHMGAELPLRGVIMLAPPNQGSGLARAFAGLRAFRWLYGPVAEELARPAGWPAPPAPFAVIAGTRAASLGNPTSWLSRGLGLLPGPSDGTVAVEETRLDGMADFRTVPASHTWIMDHPEVRRLVLAFLARGRFDE